MKLRCYDIEWDTTNEECPEGHKVDLPTEVIVEVDDDFDIEQEAADMLSDMHGWCIFGLCVEVL